MHKHEPNEEKAHAYRNFEVLDSKIRSEQYGTLVCNSVRGMWSSYD